MKSVYFKVALFLVVVLIVSFQNEGTWADKAESQSLPEKTIRVSASPEELSARSYLVKDLKTGMVLTEKASNEVLPIASVTKLFSAWVIWSDFPLDAIAKVEASDVATLGEAGGLKPGQTYSYHELLFPLLLESANDAATVYERVTEGELVAKMNEKFPGQKTSFADASGLSDKNVSSASELSDFIKMLYEDSLHILDITTLRRYVNEYGTLANNNPVLHESYRGGKHGYTESANRTLASIYEEEIGGERRPVIYVVLGSDNLDKDLAKLRTFTKEQVTFE